MICQHFVSFELILTRISFQFYSDDLVGFTEKLAASRFGGGLSFVFVASFFISFGLISGGLFNLTGDFVSVLTSIFDCASSFCFV